MHSLKFIFSTIFILLFFFQKGLACRCETIPPPCYAYGESDVVFVGTVKNVTEESELIDKVEIAVEQNFKGMNSQTALTYNESHSCAFRFKKGDKFLFYGNSNEEDTNRFSTYYCTRTTEYDEKLPDFDFFKTIQNKTQIFSIWGTLFNRYEFPVAGVKAEVFDGKKKLVGKSDKDGNLKIAVSKPGKYRVRVYIPKGNTFKLSQRDIELKIFQGANQDSPNPYIEYEVEVKNNKCGWFSTSLYNIEN